MNDEARRALEREVAGLPVEADALADALMQRAFDRTVVVEALLLGLNDPDPATRRAIARRAARLEGLDPRVQARLTVLTDQDDDRHVREAAAATLRAHDAPVPGEDVSRASREPRGRLAHLRLKVGTARSSAGVAIIAEQDSTPGFEGVISADGAGGAVVVLRGVPSVFAGHRPALRAAEEPNGARSVVAVTQSPVSASGHALIPVPAELVPYKELLVRLDYGVDLELLDDG